MGCKGQTLFYNKSCNTGLMLWVSRDSLLNRKPGSSKTFINQRLTGVFIKRVIFRVITPKVTLGGFKFEAQRALVIDETPLRVF